MQASMLGGCRLIGLWSKGVSSVREISYEKAQGRLDCDSGFHTSYGGTLIGHKSSVRGFQS